MAETTTISIAVEPGKVRLLNVPLIVRVARNSIIRWEIMIPDTDFKSIPYLQKVRQVGFTLYFDKERPFPWVEKSIVIETPSISGVSAQTLLLSEDEAMGDSQQQDGQARDYKYGIRLADAKNRRVIYDEDPILTIY